MLTTNTFKYYLVTLIIRLKLVLTFKILGWKLESSLKNINYIHKLKKLNYILVLLKKDNMGNIIFTGWVRIYFRCRRSSEIFEDFNQNY